MLKVIDTPESYFFELVQGALGRNRIKAEPETEMYLAHLLGHFLHTENLFARNANGQHVSKPLSFLLQEALAENEPANRALMFRHLGDFSLYFAGFFRDSFSSKLINVDYYMEMGETAYQHVASLAQIARRRVFEELAAKFPTFAEVLADVSHQTSERSEKDLLRIYDQWLRTQSEHSAKMLREAGIQPVALKGRKNLTKP